MTEQPPPRRFSPPAPPARRCMVCGAVSNGVHFAKVLDVRPCSGSWEKR